MDKRYFSEKVVEWYFQNKRSLPWRETTNPYKIWLSEIILQQTRVIQGLPYYFKFIDRFPDVAALAGASEQEVLRLWQGLGYYTRARNLHKCARVIVKTYNGIFPNSFEGLKSLPGIGDYTAAAIASISFKAPVAVVDGNVFRILSRVFGIEKEVNSPEGRKVFTQQANDLIDKRHPDIHNQAVMEFGALFCTPKNPDCRACVFVKTCFAAKHNLQHQLPLKKKPRPARKRYFYYVVMKKGNSLLMKKRSQKDIWHGLYDFHLVEKNRPVKLTALFREEQIDVSVNEDVQTSANYRHVLSHQIIITKFIIVKNSLSKIKESKNLKYYTFKKIADLPKPVLITRFLKDYQFLL